MLLKKKNNKVILTKLLVYFVVIVVVEVNCLDKVVVVVKGKPVLFVGEKLKISNTSDVGSLQLGDRGVLLVTDENYENTGKPKQLGVFAKWDYWKIIKKEDCSMLHPILVPPEKYPPSKATLNAVMKAWRTGTLDVLPAGWTIIYPYN